MCDEARQSRILTQDGSRCMLFRAIQKTLGSLPAHLEQAAQRARSLPCEQGVLALISL